MKKQTIFISFSLGFTSVSDYFLELASSLSKTYHIVVFSDKTLPEGLEVLSEIEIKYWPSKRPTKFADFKFLRNAINDYRPILTISNFGSVNIFLLAGFVSSIKNRVAWCHTLSTQFPQKKFNVFRKKLVYKFATKIVSNSNATKMDLNKVFGVPIVKIEVLPNSVKNFLHTLPLVKLDNNKITYVGRLHPSKGIDVLISAVSLLKKEGLYFNLDIIGSGSEKSNLELLINQLEIEKQVKFLGTKSKKDVLTAFQNSYCVVVPSYSEAFGFTVIEAMSVKTCVIGANNTGIKEIIVNNYSGLLFETGDSEDLALKLKFLFQNSDERDRMAYGGFTRFINKYETSYAVDRDVLFFKSLLNE